MDVEHLTKTQIVLLALLCTFVASIATGIVTVSLLAQAPPAVPQTINHIIQRTVETVAPSTITSETPTTETVKETTVIVKEDELLSNTITASFAKLGIVHGGVGTSTPVVALGIPVGNMLITDSTAASDTHTVEFGDSILTYKFETKFAEVGIAVLRLTEGKAPTGFRIADTGQTKLGQSVVVLPSASGSRVGIGAITARYTLGRIGDDADETSIRAIETNIGSKPLVGAPLLNAFGDLLGVSSAVSQGSAGGAGTYVALSDLAPLFLNVRGTSTPPVAGTILPLN